MRAAEVFLLILCRECLAPFVGDLDAFGRCPQLNDIALLAEFDPVHEAAVGQGMVKLQIVADAGGRVVVKRRGVPLQNVVAPM